MRKIKNLNILIFGVTVMVFIIIAKGCYKNGSDISRDPLDSTNLSNEIDIYLTSADQKNLLQKLNVITGFTNKQNNYPTILIDTTKTFQTIDGFGYTLTGGSAMLIQKMNSYNRENLLQELFGCIGEQTCISYLRLSMGASDLDESVFSYNDLPLGLQDLSLTQFSLAKDTLYLIPLLKEILKISPNIKLMSSPWSPPTWMKSNNNSIGGYLLPEYYSVYADYIVKYLLAMQSHGITIDAVTIQNEPQHGGNNPSLLMSATEQALFIKNHLGPKLKGANLDIKIVVWDHNCDKPEYPISILNDAGANAFVDGSAFHLYAGDISAMSTVHNAFPNKNLYFTEQWTGANGSFSGDLQWHIKNVVIGSLRNHSKNVLEWNLANDPSYKPHTPGGCSQCKGAITIDGNIYQKNVSYFIIAHASRFIPYGSVRIESNSIPNLHNVVFQTPEGKKVMIALNDTDNTEIFNIEINGKRALTSLTAHTVATFVW